MARFRLILCAALLLACIWVAAGAPQALGAHKRAYRTVVWCVKWSRSSHTHSASFRTTHRPRHAGRCLKHSTHRLYTRSHRAPFHHHAPAAPHRRSAAADTGAGCADTGLAPTQWNVERIRAATLCLVNRERAGHGESALQSNGRLEQAAQSHTESMAFGNYFEHTGPSGDTLLSRLRASGYIYSSQLGYSIAENIAWGTLSQGTPRAILAAWMASTGHRENILDPHFRDTAVGVSPHVPTSFGHGQPGGIYTQDFGVITGR